MRRERAEMWREAFASERRLIPDVPEGVCGGASLPMDWLLESDETDPALELPWYRRKLLATLAARAEMLTKQDEATGERARGPREE